MGGEGGGEILGWGRRCPPIWSKKQVDSAGTLVQGYVGGLLWLGGEPGCCFVSKSVGQGLYLKGHLVWAARARTWRPESPHGSRLGYLLMLISCVLFQLNPRAWVDAPTIRTTTKRSCHHLAISKHQHHNNEYNVDNNDYNNNVKNIVSATHTQERSISCPHSNISGIQYHQLQDLIFQAIPIILVFWGLLIHASFSREAIYLLQNWSFGLLLIGSLIYLHLILQKVHDFRRTDGLGFCPPGSRTGDICDWVLPC